MTSVLAFGMSSTLITSSDDYSEPIKLWNLAAAGAGMAPPAIAALRGPRPTWSPKDTVASVDINDSRRQLAAGSWDGFVRLYDLNSLKCLTNPGMLGQVLLY